MSLVLILGVAIAVAALLVLLITTVLGISRGAVGMTSALVRGDRDAVLNDLQISLATSKNTVCRRDPSAVTAEWSVVPGWAIAVAILLFPFGLLALVARQTLAGTVLVEPTVDGVVKLRIGGTFNRTSVAAINDVIGQRS